MKLKEFKIRASQAGKIMTGTIGLTETQSKTLSDLWKKEKRTDKQTQTMLGLMDKRDNPVLPKTLTSYCDLWIKEQIYGRRKEINTKYMEKGKIQEDVSIDFIADQLEYGFLMKNTEQFEDEYKTGEPDVLPSDDTIIDAKNSWDFSTFPLFAEDIDPDYYGQGQVYMDLASRSRYKLAYVLSDTPEHLIKSEASYYLRKNGYGMLEDNPEVLEEFTKRMTYSDIDDKYKIKVFEFEYDRNYIEDLHYRVGLCRKYIKEKTKDL